jgi:hypothetical protein
MGEPDVGMNLLAYLHTLTNPTAHQLICSSVYVAHAHCERQLYQLTTPTPNKCFTSSMLSSAVQ